MSDKNKKQDLIRNEDTLLRRAWIESALQGVRSSLASRTAAPEYGERASTDAPAPEETNSVARFSGAASKRPALYVAWSAGRRRSAT
jgi:hypothetical protein